MGRTRTATVLTGVLLAAAAAVAVPATAQAAKADCFGSEALCLWHNQYYRGTLFAPVVSDGHLGDDSDDAHSVYNNTKVAWVLYDDENFDDSDRHFCIRSGVSNPDLGASPYKFGDKITSVRRLTSNDCGDMAQIAQGPN